MNQDPAIAFYENVYRAMIEGDLARLEELTDLSSFPCGTDGWLGRSWLTTAVETSNEAAVSWVLSKGASATYVDDAGATALTTAIEIEGNYNLSTFRRERLSDEDVAALTIRIIDLLVEAGIDVNQRVGALQSTALHSAAAFSSPAVVRHLLSLGADPLLSDHDYECETPVERAMGLKRWPVYEVLKRAARAAAH